MNRSVGPGGCASASIDRCPRCHRRVSRQLRRRSMSRCARLDRCPGRPGSDGCPLRATTGGCLQASDPKDVQACQTWWMSSLFQQRKLVDVRAVPEMTDVQTCQIRSISRHPGYDGCPQVPESVDVTGFRSGGCPGVPYLMDVRTVQADEVGGCPGSSGDDKCPGVPHPANVRSCSVKKAFEPFLRARTVRSLHRLSGALK